MRNNILTLITVLLFGLAGTEVSASGGPMNAESKTGYAPIHGMQIYYEIHGQGKPMVLLHGGITAFEGFGANIDALAKSRQVIAVHLQGHGNTADIDRPYRFEALADDVAALVAYLKLGKIDLVGYSFGGGVALQTAIRHPEIVDHLVVISSVMAQTGFYPEGLAAFAQMGRTHRCLQTASNSHPLRRCTRRRTGKHRSKRWANWPARHLTGQRRLRVSRNRHSWSLPMQMPFAPSISLNSTRLSVAHNGTPD